MIENFCSEIINDWGATKALEVMLVILATGGIGGIVSMNLIPNKPNNIEEKENES